MSTSTSAAASEVFLRLGSPTQARSTYKSKHGPPLKPMDDVSTSNDGSSACDDLDLCTPDLPFHRVGLVGRDKELRLLRNAFNTTCMQANRWHSSCQRTGADTSGSKWDGRESTLSAETQISPAAPTPESNNDSSNKCTGISSQTRRTEPSSKRSLVLISGHSGSGKTALAMQVKRFAQGHGAAFPSNGIGSSQHHRPFHGFFVSGKCEISRMNAEQPYAGIKLALAHLCNQILCLPQDEDEDEGIATFTMPSLESTKASEVAMQPPSTAASSTSSSESSSSSMRSPSSSSLKSLRQPQPQQQPATPSDEDPRHLSTLRRVLKNGMNRDEIQVLSHVIPDLPRVIYGLDYIRQARGSGPKDDASIMSASTGMSHRRNRARPWNNDRVGYRAHGDRLKFAMRRFITLICNYCPLIFTIDDLQWADKASLDIMKAWMLDGKNSSLMIIGCYRSNLLEENGVLKTTLTSLDESKRERSLRIVKLSVQDLEAHHINELLCSLLSDRSDHPGTHDADDDLALARSKEVDVLAKVVHRRTAGNPFFIQRFLRSLVDERFLKPRECNSQIHPISTSTSAIIVTGTSRPKWAWVWSDSEIQANSPVAGSIIDLMKDKLQKMQHARQILPIAACLGASFSHSTICIAMRGLSIHSEHSTFVRKVLGINRFVSTKHIRKMLRACEREGLLEGSTGPERSDDQPTDAAHKTEADTRNAATTATPTTRRTSKPKHPAVYNFSHDKVQEAALDMVDPQQLSELKYRVGEILLFGLPEDELEQRIFMIANLVNTRLDLVSATKASDRVKRSVMLNLNAGTKAVGCSAFQLAFGYFQNAISLLPEDHRQSLREEAMEIHSAAAECAYVISKFDMARTYCNVIIGAKCDILDKVDAYHTLIDVALAEAQHDARKSKALQLCSEILLQLGCKLPKAGIKRSLSDVAGLIRWKNMARSLTAKTIDDMPLTEDRRQLAIMRTLDKLLHAAFYADPNSVPSVALQILRRTFKYGLSEHSSSAFVTLGLIMGFFMNDSEAAENYAQAAFGILRKIENPVTEADTITTCYSTIKHWRQPLETIVEPLMEAYRIATSTGDMSSAAWDITVCSWARFTIGTSLHQLDDDSVTHSKVLLDFHQASQYVFFASLWQAILNLRGLSEHRILLIGDAFDERSDMDNGENTMSEVYQRSITMTKTILCSFFGEYEEGAKLSAPIVDQHTQDNAGSIGLAPTTFCTALCCFAASHTTTTTTAAKRRKYRKVAKRCLRRLKGWNKQGHPNCPHYITILDAERQFLRGKHESAAKCYRMAIGSAAKRGYIQDQAMANERLGDCLMDHDELKEAVLCYEEALRWYAEWGATRKVKDLKAKVHGIIG